MCKQLSHCHYFGVADEAKEGKVRPCSCEAVMEMFVPKIVRFVAKEY